MKKLKKVLKREKRTLTLWYDSANPCVSLCFGHVGSTAFNAAFKAEGWKGDWVYKENLRHEHWAKKKNGGWHKVNKETKGAHIVTVMDW